MGTPVDFSETSRNSFPFLKLAGELRNLIYSHALITPREHQQRGRARNLLARPPALLQVSRQIRKEGFLIYCCENNFQLPNQVQHIETMAETERNFNRFLTMKNWCGLEHITRLIVPVRISRCKKDCTLVLQVKTSDILDRLDPKSPWYGSNAPLRCGAGDLQVYVQYKLYSDLRTDRPVLPFNINRCKKQLRNSGNRTNARDLLVAAIEVWRSTVFQCAAVDIHLNTQGYLDPNSKQCAWWNVDTACPNGYTLPLEMSGMAERRNTVHRHDEGGRCMVGNWATSDAALVKVQGDFENAGDEFFLTHGLDYDDERGNFEGRERGYRDFMGFPLSFPRRI
ncbi:hypothetical protein M501DRAFT_1013839 [Patellaria atrata CBS 101060]|uniref:Uncharacterized protein n=1 Tax=Patellaria atrata CBS 101060 TaxID=1346257 RepID=A0A9P4SHK2_9PEZI|nr:hypothetical protein M501DRAFT_1013839 [Patellaria atrata CBS 101060]